MKIDVLVSDLDQAIVISFGAAAILAQVQISKHSREGGPLFLRDCRVGHHGISLAGQFLFSGLLFSSIHDQHIHLILKISNDLFSCMDFAL
jgi:hypothetical protein